MDIDTIDAIFNLRNIFVFLFGFVVGSFAAYDNLIKNGPVMGLREIMTAGLQMIIIFPVIYLLTFVHRWWVWLLVSLVFAFMTRLLPRIRIIESLANLLLHKLFRKHPVNSVGPGRASDEP